MRPVRKLTLQVERLVELSSGQLRLVVGAGPSIETALCVTGNTACASDFQQCLTTDCVPTAGCRG